VTRESSIPALERPDNLPVVIVHGGSQAHGYRDVLEALDLALNLGADGFEFDVRQTADGVLVVHHDDAIVSDALSGLAYADAARAAAASGYQLPRLDDVLSRCRGALRLDVELKDAGFETAVVTLLRSSGYTSAQFVVTSFDQRALAVMHQAHPEVVTGLLTYDVTGPVAIKQFRQSGAAFLGPDYQILDDDTLRLAVTASVPLVPWTVNEPAALDRLMRASAVAGIITDRPREALRLRHHRAANRDQ
jgi:glycerophosphoryl diester phosphodiesterase